jgi:hypothetical protein
MRTRSEARHGRLDWSRVPDKLEARCLLYVALSRAKKRPMLALRRDEAFSADFSDVIDSRSVDLRASPTIGGFHAM